MGASGQLVEGERCVVGVVVGIVAAQGSFDLLADGVGEGDATGIASDKRLYVWWEEAGMGDEQTGIFGLPLVAVGGHTSPASLQWGRITKVGLQVGGLVEEDPEEEVGVDVSVDADFVKIMWGERTAVVTQLRCSLAGDVEMDLVEVEIIIYPIHRTGRQVVGKDATVFFFGGQNEGQSQWLRLCLCMLALLPQAAQTKPTTSNNAITRSILRRLITAIITSPLQKYCVIFGCQKAYF